MADRREKGTGLILLLLAAFIQAESSEWGRLNEKDFSEKPLAVV